MALKAKSLSNLFMWIIMGLLLVGLAGFGAVNLSGSARSIGAVGDKDIGIDRYASALQQELRRIQSQSGQAVSFADAQAAGLDRQVLSQLVTATALEWEADRIGLSVGDEEVAEQLGAIQAFQGPNGAFDREAYRFARQNAGLSEAEFEEDLRNEAARAVLQGAVVSGANVSDVYVDTLVAYLGETRDVTWAILDGGALATGVPEPDSAALEAYYEDNLARYTRPETKRLTYALIAPDMLVDSVEVPEEALRQAYEEREAEFNLPARRLVERLIFPSEEAAQQAAEKLAAGETDFETLVAERGLALADVDMGVVDRDDLGAAAEAVFKVSTGEVAGPAPTPLGPALFRVNAVLAAMETPFEEAKSTLRDSLVLDAARNQIRDMGEDLENRLAGGATLEELAEETGMELGEIDYAGENGDGITAYPAFREAVAALEPGDYPDLHETGDGGFFAVRVDEVLPEAPRPFDEVRDQVATGWERAQITEALTERAEGLAQQLAEGESFEAAGLEPNALDAVTRGTSIDALPQGAVDRLFELAEGEVAVLPGQGRVALLRLDAVVAADMESDTAKARAERLRQEAGAAIAEDLFSAYAADIQSRAGVEINQAALNSVNSQMQ